MSVRVVARLRPLLKAEVERDQIVSIQNGPDDKPTIVKVPNPKNQSEEFGFQFNSVYGQGSTQQQIFEAEVSPTVKHLFQGYDVTIFAYGSTGTGKTHTMRGGKSLADRGMIPRLLSGIYRKSRAIEKSSENETNVEVSMSYYEIYNDRVYDLFEAPEKRNATGLPIREAEGGKTVVVGLTEMPCSNLKDFEALYDRANANRSTGATKLNAHSSRSHAILCVKVTISTATETRVSTASAIDLAGSEDNRRTGNGKDRMVESASINKSLFVLAQCVEAISKKQHRIPYRESKMTRILSLGQNNGFTVMILNLAPTKGFHLDTLSSLNFANRTKKIEVREVENEPMFKGPPRPPVANGNAHAQRRPLQPLTNHINVNLAAARDPKTGKPAKEFSVYSDKSRQQQSSNAVPRTAVQKSSPLKRGADQSMLSSRPTKQSRSIGLASTSLLSRGHHASNSISASQIESLVERKVTQILAEKALAAPAPAPSQPETKDVSADVQARLDSIEKRLEGQEGERAEGLSYLFMAKQHQARGENFSALKMYELARPFFSGNEKLEAKIDRLKKKLDERKRKETEADRDQDYPGPRIHDTENECQEIGSVRPRPLNERPAHRGTKRRTHKAHTHGDIDGDDLTLREDPDESYHAYQSESTLDSEDEYASDTYRARTKKSKTAFKTQRRHKQGGRKSSPDPLNGHSRSMQPDTSSHDPPTPRTVHILSLLNTRNPSKIQKLNGLGAKRAELIVEFLNQRFDREDEQSRALQRWDDVLGLDIRGIGTKSWEGVREGLASAC